MINIFSKSLLIAGLLAASGTAFAQSGNSGNLGSAALGIDFFAGSVVGGSNQESDGGLVNSIEAAFSGTTTDAGTTTAQQTDAGKRKQ